MDVDGARVAELVAAEDRVEQFLAREQAAARAQQRVEDLELGVGQGQLGAGDLGAPRVGVEPQRAVGTTARGAPLRWTRRRTARTRLRSSAIPTGLVT